MKDMFYVPMQEFMGLSNTQIGAALSVYGIVQTIGLIAGIYICDIISKKYMIGGSLIGIWRCRILHRNVPRRRHPHWLPAGLWLALAILGEATYWPVFLAEGHSPFG